MTDVLLTGWNRNLDYAQKLVADIAEDRMVAQPGPGMNHPAWLISHLNAYHPVIEKLIRGESFEDPKGHRFGMQSKPEADASLYAPKAELIRSFAEGHDRIAAVLQAAPAEALEQPVTLERWRSGFPNVAAILGYLMLVHESTHLGQLSAWRRVQGMPAV